jgi:hypothetical protein
VTALISAPLAPVTAETAAVVTVVFLIDSRKRKFTHSLAEFNTAISSHGETGRVPRDGPVGLRLPP